MTSEIGDTWIYGAGSDPSKIVEYRELLRFWRGYQGGSGGGPEFDRFARLLLKVSAPEQAGSALSICLSIPITDPRPASKSAPADPRAHVGGVH